MKNKTYPRTSDATVIVATENRPSALPEIAGASEFENDGPFHETTEAIIERTRYAPLACIMRCRMLSYGSSGMSDYGIEGHRVSSLISAWCNPEGTVSSRHGGNPYATVTINLQ